MPPVKIGILALQGAFREHRRAFARLGVDATEVRLPRHLDGLDALVVPGGESTTMAKLMLAYQLDSAIAAFHANGGAVWGTCAGAILIAREVVGRPEQPRLDLIDLTVARNAYGRQVASFEADLTIDGLDGPFRGVFIRAPRIVATGPEVEVLARHDGDAVAAASGRVLATVFHPELAGDDRLHALFLDRFARRAAATAAPAKGRP
jgi:5'-phosphate synthase pdxT subunit